MRTVFPVVAAAVMLVFSACEANQSQETSSATTLEEAANATDIAETTAAPIDTAAYKTDSLSADTTGTN
ncbi:hypothetical protein [Rufibacter tibetensis]|uniref:Uncharacterized protein n=1 Tax=Rufibacter tibetensis TaxID=512763 RepID=A0A0N7HWH4_9BACT|nr:hypothetical protein [Rufibacter tibetensis]ALI99256.1 hypothetical protein DC20_10055 [Rufibacter tibetensis]